MKKFRKILNLEETIALTSGVLVLSVAVALVVIAWSGPTAEAPLNNAPAPINTGDTAQVKTGDLTVGNLSLDDGTGRGDITGAEDITGGNDLFLHSKTNKTEILLDEDGGEGIKFYTGGTERMVVGDDGNLYVPGLSDCFLQVDDNGKVSCYTGGTIPGGNVLETTQFNVASVRSSCNSPGDGSCYGGKDCKSYTILAGDVERVIRVSASVRTWRYYGNGYFDFYINGATEWYKHCGNNSKCSYSATKYYHVMGGDVLKVCVSASGWYGGGGSVSGKMWILGAKRELITHAFSDGTILYWYDQGARGEMSTPPDVGHYIGADPPSSVIVSAKDSIDLKWILD